MLGKEISSKFSLYDQIGYLLVGSVALLLVAGNFWLIEGARSLPTFALGTTVVWLIVAYLIGHIVQAIANIFIRENKHSYSEADKAVLDDVRRYFDNPDWNDKQAFQHCYILACGRDIAGHVAAFNAYYSLYRGWSLLFAGESIFLAIAVWGTKGELQWILLLISCLLVTILMFRRRKRYWDYVTAKTLQTFVVVRRLDR